MIAPLDKNMAERQDSSMVASKAKENASGLARIEQIVAEAFSDLDPRRDDFRNTDTEALLRFFTETPEELRPAFLRQCIRRSSNDLDWDTRLLESAKNVLTDDMLVEMIDSKLGSPAGRLWDDFYTFLAHNGYLGREAIVTALIKNGAASDLVFYAKVNGVDLHSHTGELMDSSRSRFYYDPTRNLEQETLKLKKVGFTQDQINELIIRADAQRKVEDERAERAKKKVRPPGMPKFGG